MSKYTYMNIRATIKKLQRALINKGTIYKINTYQFYSEEQQRLITGYKITQKQEYKKKSGEMSVKDVELLNTCSQVEVLQWFVKEWRKVNGLIDADILDKQFEEVKEKCEKLGDVAQIIGVQAVIDAQPTISTIKFNVIDTKTGNYPDIEKIARTEEWACGLAYFNMKGFAINEDGQLILMDECGDSRYCPNDRFKIEFEGI